MRQPKFIFGQIVKVPIRMTANAGDVVLESLVTYTARVIGISYDPADGTNGHPFYKYSILIKNGIKTGVREEALEEVEG